MENSHETAPLAIYSRKKAKILTVNRKATIPHAHSTVFNQL